MGEEIWKDIPGYEGKYQVSNFGRVKSVARTVVYSDGRISHTKEKLLKPSNNTNGYLLVGLWTNNKSKYRYVHSLVLESFIGPRPDGLDVCHNDGDPHNNKLDNLRYDTHRNNLIDEVRRNRQPSQKLFSDDVKEIRKLLDKKELTQVQIAMMYNVSPETVGDIKAQRSWSWLKADE